MNFWKKLDKPIKVLAPMAGYTDSAFRLVCKKFGCDVVVSELISADAIYHHAKNWYFDEKTGEWRSKRGYDETLEMLKFDEAERPYVIQLFGKFPEKFAYAAKWVSENIRPDGIDINMGCPARKVVGSDHGAALLKNPKLASEIVRSVKANTDLAVSVKTRLGWEDDDEILKFAPILAEAGIDELMIHGRTYKDGFKNKARWENIYKVKEMFGDKIVVIGNGDIGQISNPSTGSGQVLQFLISNQIPNPNFKTGKKIENQKNWLDGVAIGRATFGKPWIFSKNEISIEELKELILYHADLAFKSKDKKGIIEFRKHLLSYIKGFPDAKELRKVVVAIENIDDVAGIVEKMQNL